MNVSKPKKCNYTKYRAYKFAKNSGLKISILKFYLMLKQLSKIQYLGCSRYDISIGSEYGYITINKENKECIFSTIKGV